MEQEKIHVLIAGTRTFNDYNLFCTWCDRILKNFQNIEIVSGGARGADALAERYAKEKGYEFKCFPANWDLHGKSAGYKRNIEMQDYVASFPKRGCICFWDGQSKGTAHHFDTCKKKNIQLSICQYNKLR